MSGRGKGKTGECLRPAQRCALHRPAPESHPTPVRRQDEHLPLSQGRPAVSRGPHRCEIRRAQSCRCAVSFFENLICLPCSLLLARSPLPEGGQVRFARWGGRARLPGGGASLEPLSGCCVAGLNAAARGAPPYPAFPSGRIPRRVDHLMMTSAGLASAPFLPFYPPKRHKNTDALPSRAYPRQVLEYLAAEVLELAGNACNGEQLRGVGTMLRPDALGLLPLDNKKRRCVC